MKRIEADIVEQVHYCFSVLVPNDFSEDMGDQEQQVLSEFLELSAVERDTHCQTCHDREVVITNVVEGLPDTDGAASTSSAVSTGDLEQTIARYHDVLELVVAGNTDPDRLSEIAAHVLGGGTWEPSQ